MRIIINADDCGYSSHVNQHIKEAIDAGKITSTTIMANMEAVEGAFALYGQYHDSISFGVHLNLTEGEPLLKSKALLDYGYYGEEDGRMLFNSSKAEHFRYKLLPQYVKNEIYKELKAQVETVRLGGVQISHFDSHHHIHTCFSLMGVMAQLCKDCNIHKVRNIRNYVPSLLSYCGRRVWEHLSKIYNRKYVMTDFFAIFQEFMTQDALPLLKEKSTIELMVHPGGIYLEEEELLMKVDLTDNGQLINYNTL